MNANPATAFDQLALHPSVLQALDTVGYESPSPIQARAIPVLLTGQDLLGQAQTGTGKTAAFALPILSRLDLARKKPQVLVLAPTRELALQVAEAFQKYASCLPGFHVLPIYGGQDYRTQIRALQRGVHVVVGTPGRVMDHMDRGTLVLDELNTLVLDEADEMLRMGFIDDVQWILERAPAKRQIALFSATMPRQIRQIAEKHLQDPVTVTVEMKTATADTIRQRFWPVSGLHKLDALTRILEVEPFEAMLVFVRTKTATVELAEKLGARGYEVAALNGDIPQAQRERVVERLKQGKIDILVATDVAARGLDVERISHVLNYDIPYDTEAYIHRIGRTGRAGRHGEAILFVAPREKRLLHAIEKATGGKIETMELPSTENINDARIARFKQRITDTLATEEIGFFYQLIEQYQQEHNIPALEIAAALAVQVQGDAPFLLQKARPAKANKLAPQADKPAFRAEKSASRGDKPAPRADKSASRADKPAFMAGRVRDSAAERRPRPERAAAPEQGMERFRVEVGQLHGVKPGNIVGAIANEAELDSRYIGRIDIQDDYSLIDLPEGMPKEIFNILKKVWVSGQQLRISRVGETKTRKPAGKASSRHQGDKAAGFGAGKKKTAGKHARTMSGNKPARKNVRKKPAAAR